MKSLNSVGIGLSVVFACLFVALLAELYYLFWCKKRLTNNASELQTYDHSVPAQRLFYTFCWRHRNHQRQSTPQNDNNDNDNDQDFLFKSFAGAVNDNTTTTSGNNGQQNLPPRFLFTIAEETREDLESEDGVTCKSRNTSLGDLLHTPYLTPLASPPFFTPPLTPGQTMFDCVSSSSPPSSLSLLSSSSSSSPPSKFKFLQEAEEKLKQNDDSISNDDSGDDEENEESEESFITITVDRRSKLVYEFNNIINPTTNTVSQVLPLYSSPSIFNR